MNNTSSLANRIQSLTSPLEAIPVNHETSLQKLPNIQCVAFDFYGTMFISGVGDIGIDEDQQQDSTSFFVEALEKAGFALNDNKTGKKGIQIFEQVIARHKRKAKENGIDYPEPNIMTVWQDVLVKLHQNDIIEGDISKESATLFGVEFEFLINNIWPEKNLGELLNSLLDKGLELGIISNSQFYTPIAFEAFLGKSPEEFGFNPNLLIWSYRTGRKKPSRAFYKLFVDAARKESIAAENVLYVGNDIHKDVAPAKALGMRTALYVGDQRSIRHEEAELQEPEFTPDIIIDDLHQILECV